MRRTKNLDKKKLSQRTDDNGSVAGSINGNVDDESNDTLYDDDGKKGVYL